MLPASGQPQFFFEHHGIIESKSDDEYDFDYLDTTEEESLVGDVMPLN